MKNINTQYLHDKDKIRLHLLHHNTDGKMTTGTKIIARNIAKSGEEDDLWKELKESLDTIREEEVIIVY